MLSAVLKADDDKVIRVDQLPQKVQQFVSRHFPDGKVAVAKMGSDFLDRNYDVLFTNGDKLEFDKKGEWKEVDCRYSAVPKAVVPAPIWQYVTTHYPGATILKIERDKKEYEVRLSTGYELTFTTDFKLVDVER